LCFLEVNIDVLVVINVLVDILIVVVGEEFSVTTVITSTAATASTSTAATASTSTAATASTSTAVIIVVAGFSVAVTQTVKVVVVVVRVLVPAVALVDTGGSRSWDHRKRGRSDTTTGRNGASAGRLDDLNRSRKTLLNYYRCWSRSRSDEFELGRSNLLDNCSGRGNVCGMDLFNDGLLDNRGGNDFLNNDGGGGGGGTAATPALLDGIAAVGVRTDGVVPRVSTMNARIDGCLDLGGVDGLAVNGLQMLVDDRLNDILDRLDDVDGLRVGASVDDRWVDLGLGRADNILLDGTAAVLGSGNCAGEKAERDNGEHKRVWYLHLHLESAN
jgi:hypothetical protein